MDDRPDRMPVVYCLRMVIACLAFWLGGMNLCVWAEDHEGHFESRTLTDARGSHRYQVYLPSGYHRERLWPLVVFLHGAGERGTDGVISTQVGLGVALRRRPELYPCVVVFPQCESWDDRIETSWSARAEAGQLARQIVSQVEQAESIDPQQRILTGWSMGGFGAVQWAATEPHRWQRTLAVSGGATAEGHPDPDYDWGTSSLWLIHGTRDGVVSVERSRGMAAHWEPSPVRRFDEVTAVGHEVWQQVYGDPRVARWLITGGEIPKIDWSEIDPAVAGAPLSPEIPFVTAARLNQAVELRLGNDALAMLSAGIPEAASPERLNGALEDIRESFSIDGEAYELQLSGLSYSARLLSARVAARSTADVQVDLGVSVDLRIGAAHLTTTGFAAHTGPFRIVIGHRRETPLRLSVKPTIVQDRIRLQLGQSGFPIEDDNWYVERPREIELQGTRFTRHEIETGIVGGLYTRKSEVEDVVTSVIPPLLRRVEERLNQETSSQVTQWLWPLPVYQPRMRLAAEALSIDHDGLTISMGLDLAASRSAETGPLTPLHAIGRARLPDPQRRSRNLHFELDSQLIRVVSQEFVGSGAARINVLDIPEPRFAAFASLERMRPLLPEAAQTTSELRAVLAMAGPFEWQVMVPSQAVGDRTQTQLSIPHARLELFTRSAADQPWAFAMKWNLSVQQQIDFQMEAVPDAEPRQSVIWSDQPVIHLQGTATVADEPLRQLESELRQAWIAWGQSNSRRGRVVQDFIIGDSRLRLGNLQLNDSTVRVDLFSPEARIQAEGGTLRYHLREGHATWGVERHLAPGDSHRYRLINSIPWRVVGEDSTRTLRPGESVTIEVGDNRPRP